ncbi:MAG: benzoate-CoA ligase family protein [Desulfobacterota bacterium]|nr:benzoate-CoA ligase family protein [Thermodesulfobacteriota bacterium]MDW8001636.1 benzoate-CoA ligase family protein [Deltaproteobacteria bacterium]
MGRISLLDYKVPDFFNQVDLLLERHIREERGGNVAIYYGDQGITYADLYLSVNRLGNSLKNLGIEPEDRILIILNDSPEFITAYLASMKIGAVPCPVNTLAQPKDYVFFASDSRSKALFVNFEHYEKIREIKKEVPSLKHVIIVGGSEKGTINYSELISKGSSELQVETTSKDDMAFWMYTSGTTGVPKGVIHLHHDICYYIPPFAELILGITEKDVIFATSKMFFSYGRNASLEIPLLYGASVILWPKWPRPEDIIELIETKRPSIFFSVPTFYNAILKQVEKRGFCDFSSIRACVSAGEPLPKEIFEKWERRFSLEIIDGVGSTDVGGIYMANKEGKRKPGSSGKIIQGFEGELRGDDGLPVKQGSVGTLWIKNDGVTPGYWRRHDKNKEVIKGEWFNTGDLFLMDEDGYFYYQGRADDMLKVSGQWVSPLEVENALMEHPAVKECGVGGVPSEEGLIKIKAFVVLNEGYRPSDDLEREIIEHVKAKIAHFKVPKSIAFVEELPRTVTGKLVRYKLRN